MTPSAKPTGECSADEENTTGFRDLVWEALEGEGDKNRCPNCRHEYFSDDNWGELDPRAIEYAEHLNHAERKLAALRKEHEKLKVGLVNLINAAELQLVHLGAEAPDFMENLRLARRALASGPTPCGHAHRSLSAIYECAVAHPEVVGFSVVEVSRSGGRRGT